MKTKLRALRRALFTLVLVSFAVAGASQPGSPVLLRLKFHAGEVSRYQSSVQMSYEIAGQAAPGESAQPIQQSAIYSQLRVKKVLSSGSAQLEVTTNGSRGTLANQPMNLPASPKPILATVDTLGHVSGVQGAGVPGVSSMTTDMLGANILGLQGVLLPRGPVYPGDHWSRSTQVPGAGVATTTVTFVRMEKVGASQTALMHVVLTMPVALMLDAAMQPTGSANVAQITMAGTLVINIDNDLGIVEGKLIRSSGTGRATMRVHQKSVPARGARSQAPLELPVNLKFSIGSTLLP